MLTMAAATFSYTELLILCITISSSINIMKINCRNTTSIIINTINTRCAELWPRKRWGDGGPGEVSEWSGEWNEDSEKVGGRDRGPGREVEILLLVSCCCCNLLPQILRLKITQTDSLTLWTLEGQNGSHWVKIKVSAGLCSFWRLWGKNSFPCLCQLLEATTCLAATCHVPAWLWPSVVTLLLSPPHFPLMQILEITLGQSENPGSSPHFKP